MPVPVPIAVVGGGRMGEAIIAGLIAVRVAAPSEILVAEPDPARRAYLGETYGIAVAPDGSSLVGAARVVVLAVKPQVVDEVARGIAPFFTTKPPTVVSIAAGIRCTHLESLLPEGTPVVRVMPNAPAMVGEGMSAVSPGCAAGPTDVAIAVDLFSSLGKVVVVDEPLQDAVTALSGSGPAYVAVFLEALAHAGERHGLGPKVAYTLALQTLRGTCELLDRTGQEPAELVVAVSSPGGTTVAALSVLEAGGFAGVIGDAVDAAVVRSKELGA